MMCSDLEGTQEGMRCGGGGCSGGRGGLPQVGKGSLYCIFKFFVLQLPTRDLQLLCVFCFETLAIKTVLSAFWFSLSHPLACRRNKRRSATRGKNIQYGKLFPNSHNNHNYCTALPESANIEIFKRSIQLLHERYLEIQCCDKRYILSLRSK